MVSAVFSIDSHNFLGEASKIWEVGRKSVGNSLEVAKKFCADYYPARSNT